jgi:DNA invertase Pin-like site-specific DNA recombinase
MAAKQAPEKTKSPKVFGQARKPAKMFRAGLYARVSTNDQQTVPLQIRTLREYAVRRGWTITLQVKEVGSGASQRQLREKLLEAVRRREIDVVLVAVRSLGTIRGRPTGDSPGTAAPRRRLRLADEALDLTTPAGRAMAALLAVFAEFEREILRERVRAGLAHARRNGKKLGRPATAARHASKIRTLHRAGVSKSEIARRLEIGRTSVRRILG